MPNTNYIFSSPNLLTRRLVSVLPVVISLALFLGGKDRFVSPGFLVARELAPWWAWASMFMACGVTMLINTFMDRWRMFWPAFLCSAMFGIWAIALLLSSFKSGITAFTGVAIYGWVAVVLAAMAARGFENPQKSHTVYVTPESQELTQIVEIPPPSRQPDTVFLYGLCTISGFTSAIGATTPQSIDQLIGHHVGQVWGVVLFLSSVWGLLSMLPRDRYLQLLWGRVARLGVGWACISYSVAAFSIGWHGLFAGLLIMSLGFTSLIRARQITRWSRAQRGSHAANDQ